MFRFASPELLVCLILPVIVAFARRGRAARTAMGVSELSDVSGVRPSMVQRVYNFLPLLGYFALLAVIVGLARPQWGQREVTVKTEGVDIVLAVDLSRSMAAYDFKIGEQVVDRLEAVKDVVARFIAGRDGDRLGLVVFGTQAYTQAPLTMDYDVILQVLDRLRIGSAGDKTAIGDALGLSLKRLKDAGDSKVVILLTDGQNTAGQFSPEDMVQVAREKGIKVYTIGVGTKGKVKTLVENHPVFGPRYVYQQVNIDEETLTMIAESTGGLYFRAIDTQGLEKIYQTIDELEKTEAEVKVFDNYEEMYPIFLIAALLLMIAWIILSSTRFLRIP